MAISLPLTKIADSTEMVTAPGAIIQAEGLALVRLAGAQADGVQASTGVAGEIFVGVSFAGTSAAPFPEMFTNRVETYVASSTGTIKLARTPIAGQISVFNVTDNAPVSPAPTVVGDTISGLDPSKTYTSTYKFAETVIESVARQGDTQPGGYSGAIYGQIGVVTRALLLTSEFDASKNWRAATAIKLGANGQFTDQTGSGVEIRATIERLPDEDYPFLGIRFSTP